ncbi:hypothetical protein Tco_0881229 [Tanacetum coccineum]
MRNHYVAIPVFPPDDGGVTGLISEPELPIMPIPIALYDPLRSGRQAQLVDTDTESEPEEAPSEAEESQLLGFLWYPEEEGAEAITRVSASSQSGGDTPLVSLRTWVIGGVTDAVELAMGEGPGTTTYRDGRSLHPTFQAYVPPVCTLFLPPPYPDSSGRLVPLPRLDAALPPTLFEGFDRCLAAGTGAGAGEELLIHLVLMEGYPVLLSRLWQVMTDAQIRWQLSVAC